MTFDPTHDDRAVPVGERLKPPRQTGAAADAPALPASVDVAVVGAGVIGLSIAWRLARAGHSVAVFERGTAGGGTSLAATGMLAAAAEHEPGGDDLLALGLESQALWPTFRAELEADSGIAIDHRTQGTLLIAMGRDEVERLRFRHEQQRRANLATRWLTGPEARALEPGLRGSVTAGILCPDDHQVDPRLLIPALTQALQTAGGRLFENCAVLSLENEGGRICGVTTAAGFCRAGALVVAGGPWSGENLLPPGLSLPIRPVKGQALALRTTPRTGNLSHVVWTEQVHLAPKGDGRLIVGATMEEAGFNPAVTAGGALALLDGVHRALPGSEEMELEAIWSGFRPTSDDDAPILGETDIPGLLIATGHHRNGILLAPVTAKAIADMIVSGRPNGVAGRFGLDRFRMPTTPSLQPAGAWT